MAAVTTVTSKGQITIPVEVRRAMGLTEGEQVEFVIEGGVTVFRRFLTTTNPFEKWAGRLGGLTSIGEAVEWQRDLRDDDHDAPNQ
jgi:antitoxin PrlF